MDLELGGKVAVVTGASKGIGLAVVRALAAEGARVVAGARTVDALAGLDGVTAVEVDLVAARRPGALVAHALERHGRVDVLVNNVGGVQLRLGRLPLDDRRGLRGVAAAELLRGAARDARRRGRHAAAHGGGAIVNVASVNAFFHPDGLVVDYGAAKAALLNVAKALSQELGPQGIRINSVSPGPVETELWLGDHGVAATIGAATGVDAGDGPRAGHRAGSPTGRFTTPGGGGDARRAARLAAHGERHRRQLRDRRRAREDVVSVRETPRGAV